VPQTSGNGGVTITGSEQLTTIPNPNCDPDYDLYFRRGCYPTTIRVYDTGTVSITVNGYTNSVNYGRGSTASTIAYGLAAAINNDPSAYVNAGVMGTTVFLIPKATANANYPFSSSVTFDSDDFGTASFTTRNSGPTLTGNQL